MRRSLIFIALLIAAALMAACRRSNPEAAALLARADSLLNPPPSTAASQTPPAGGPQGAVALHLLDSVQHQARTAWPKADTLTMHHIGAFDDPAVRQEFLMQVLGREEA